MSVEKHQASLKAAYLMGTAVGLAILGFGVLLGLRAWNFYLRRELWAVDRDAGLAVFLAVMGVVMVGSSTFLLRAMKREGSGQS